MSYIDRNLLPDEQILFRTKKHIIIFFSSAFVTIVAAVLTVYLLSISSLFQFLIWVLWGAAILMWLKVGIDYLTSEFVVTNKRIMMREGFFFRHATELRVGAVAQVNIEQSLLGRMLNYGIVSLNAFGVSDAFPLIAKPFGFQKAVSEQLDKTVR